MEKTNIKFRAFCNVDTEEDNINKIIYFDPMQCDNGLWFESPDNVFHINEYFRIMMFSGVTDINGVDIYEGDVVKVNKDEIGSIDFNNGSFWIGFYDEPAKQNISEFIKYDVTKEKYYSQIEIVGKIAQIKS